MGKGKGSFDHWAARVAVNQIVLELRGMLHEQVARDAFRLAGNKLPGEAYRFCYPTLSSSPGRTELPTNPCPGQWEFVKKGAPPIVGITKLSGVTLEELKRPRRKIPGETVKPVPPPPSASGEHRAPLDSP